MYVGSGIKERDPTLHLRVFEYKEVTSEAPLMQRFNSIHLRERNTVLKVEAVPRAIPRRDHISPE